MSLKLPALVLNFGNFKLAVVFTKSFTLPVVNYLAFTFVEIQGKKL